MHHGPRTFNALPPFLRQVYTGHPDDEGADPPLNPEMEEKKQDPLQKRTNDFKEDLDMVLNQLPDQPYTPRDNRNPYMRRTAKSNSVYDQIKDQPKEWMERVTELFREKQARRSKGRTQGEKTQVDPHSSLLGNRAARRAPPPEMVPW